MKQALALRHVDFEDLGTLAGVLEQRGYHIRYADPAREDLAALRREEPDLLIVLGGPMRATDVAGYPFLGEEAQWLRDRRAAGRPSIGICLGAQVMAVAAGGDVAPMGLKEIGMGTISITPAGQATLLRLLADAPVLHWHGDGIALPAGEVSLATTAPCAVQAFELSGHQLGLQFHLEADLDRITDWTTGHAGEVEEAGLDGQAIAAAAKAHAQAMKAASEDFFATWLEGLPP
jgi:GMP synthase (glutamine-hydrolysing)